MPWNGGKDW